MGKFLKKTIVVVIIIIISVFGCFYFVKLDQKVKNRTNQNNIKRYSNSIKLAIYEHISNDPTGNIPTIDVSWVKTKVKSDISCEAIYYSNQYGIVLHNCLFLKDDTSYYFADNQVYSQPTEQYLTILEKVK